LVIPAPDANLFSVSAPVGGGVRWTWIGAAMIETLGDSGYSDLSQTSQISTVSRNEQDGFLRRFLSRGRTGRFTTAAASGIGNKTEYASRE
jgi:hypothetical protein